MTPPSLGRRFVAVFIDWIIASLIVALLTGSTFSGENAAPAIYPLIGYWVTVFLELSTVSTTIGKKALGLKVVDVVGGPIGPRRAAIRTSLVLLVIPVFIMNDQKRGLHDVAAGTMVVRA